MEISIALLAFISSYLLGSISFGRIIMRMMKPGESLDDIEMPIAGVDGTYKLKSIGGNTASMKLGARGGCLVGFLDIFKTFLPTLAFRLLYPDQPYFLFAALAGVIGHNWPIYYRFKGGRGISPFYGGLFAFDPLGGLVVALTSMFLGMVVFKELLLAYAGGPFLTLPWFLITQNQSPWFVYYLGYSILVNVIFIVAMIPEIRQIREMRKKYGKADVRASMDTFPMGQQMNKLMNRLGINKKNTAAKE
jgi:acyl phosphate:glycerol-3-phosphate acyltransferase